MALAADAPAKAASCSDQSAVNCDKIHRNLITTGPIRRRMGWRNCISIRKHVSCQVIYCGTHFLWQLKTRTDITYMASGGDGDTFRGYGMQSSVEFCYVGI